MAKLTGKVDAHESALSKAIAGIWAHCKLRCRVMPITNSPFDLLVAGKVRVEVKVSRQAAINDGTHPISWRFNLHRHGVISEGTVDILIFYLPPIVEFGFKYGFQLVVPANAVDGMFTIAMTPKNLMTKWGQYHKRWDLISELAKIIPKYIDTPLHA